MFPFCSANGKNGFDIKLFLFRSGMGEMRSNLRFVRCPCSAPNLKDKKSRRPTLPQQNLLAKKDTIFGQAKEEWRKKCLLFPRRRELPKFKKTCPKNMEGGEDEPC